MWCTQSFAKDDTIGRVRGGADPRPWGGALWRRLSPSTSSLRPQVGRLHGSVPNLSRYLESRDHSGPRGLPPTDYAHLQRNFWALAQKGECEQEGGTEPAGEAEGLMPAPAPAVHSSLSSVLAALTAERDHLRDLHRGSELSRTGVRLGDRVAGPPQAGE